MKDKNLAELERQAQEYQAKRSLDKISWQKNINKMTHLTPKKKKRK